MTMPSPAAAAEFSEVNEISTNPLEETETVEELSSLATDVDKQFIVASRAELAAGKQAALSEVAEQSKNEILSEEQVEIKKSASTHRVL
ncbi:hypothetical protein LRY60_04975 [Candidatus Woesebacteria bacterium]|nr:hypothetical protein [Candidatus Woesebacteria bacterium]